MCEASQSSSGCGEPGSHEQKRKEQLNRHSWGSLGSPSKIHQCQRRTHSPMASSRPFSSPHRMISLKDWSLMLHSPPQHPLSTLCSAEKVNGSFFFLINLFILLFYFIYLLFLAALGLCCCVRAFLWLRRVGATLRCGARASHSGGFSCCRARALGAQASVVVAHGLSSCGTRAQ